MKKISKHSSEPCVDGFPVLLNDILQKTRKSKKTGHVGFSYNKAQDPSLGDQAYAGAMLRFIYTMR